MDNSTHGTSLKSEPIAAGIVLVRLAGRVDSASVPAQREQLQALIDAGSTRIIVSLADVTFLDSAGLGMLVSLLKRSRLAGGDVRLVESTETAVRRILSLTRLDRVFTLAPTIEVALLDIDEA